jgi:hypothetical protein
MIYMLSSDVTLRNGHQIGQGTHSWADWWGQADDAVTFASTDICHEGPKNAYKDDRMESLKIDQVFVRLVRYSRKSGSSSDTLKSAPIEYAPSPSNLVL